MILFYPLLLSAQWSTANGINNGRNDDIFFVNDSVGYVAGGPSGEIRKTTDAGDNWSAIFTGGPYLRSIEFIDDSVGFAGSLDSSFYMTANGGATWINIHNRLPSPALEICGLSIPTDSVIYGCGVYSQPAYIVKSTDRGNTWTTIDMSPYASSLVEIHFLSADTGFVCGQADSLSDGGIIFYTTDGGQNWQSVYKTFTNLDYIWKIQSPDGVNYFASVSSVPSAGNTTFLKSTDGGMTWTQGVVDTTWHDIQMIGFLDSLKGWTGGRDHLFETVDGGATWNTVTIPGGGSYYNRFLKLNDSTAFISGTKIYKYGSNTLPVSVTKNEASVEIHSLTIFPNPTKQLRFKVNMENSSTAVIQLIDLKGNVLEFFNRSTLVKGVHEFTASKKHAPQVAFLLMRTNEGFYTEKVVLK
tara:strand:+ start:99 stop:1337 length:1239 start_codon:yes stop_codon:yes gene_type:complete